MSLLGLAELYHINHLGIFGLADQQTNISQLSRTISNVHKHLEQLQLNCCRGFYVIRTGVTNNKSRSKALGPAIVPHIWFMSLAWRHPVLFAECRPERKRCCKVQNARLVCNLRPVFWVSYQTFKVLARKLRFQLGLITRSRQAV